MFELTVPMSNGDNSGVGLNPVSGMAMGPTKHIVGSFKVFKVGMPDTKTQYDRAERHVTRRHRLNAGTQPDKGDDSKLIKPGCIPGLMLFLHPRRGETF